jgi:hypothetical protein
MRKFLLLQLRTKKQILINSSPTEDTKVRNILTFFPRPWCGCLAFSQSHVYVSTICQRKILLTLLAFCCLKSTPRVTHTHVSEPRSRMPALPRTKGMSQAAHAAPDNNTQKERLARLLRCWPWNFSPAASLRAFIHPSILHLIIKWCFTAAPSTHTACPCVCERERNAHSWCSRLK